jgi:cytochrome c biogenesis factor
MLKRLVKIFTSLRLTVTLLALGIILVFVGTIAQADEGLYQAQDRYFKHWFVWPITMFGYRIPIGLPGGYLIGTVLLVNLTGAFIKRFQFTTKKIGVHLTHSGVILLLVGQLATDIFSRETQLHFSEGETKSWSESGMDYELAFLTDVDSNREQVVAIPQSIVAEGGENRHEKLEKLPFTVKVKTYWPNSSPAFRATEATGSTSSVAMRTP